ncbi:MAG: dephospho-CoA kinase [Deltaproteobacteria bacterium]|nr:dephospho-CoA kinase [Deltaproteobacteria bacterium]
MKVIGLTGGIASGKSTVARLLAAMGVPVVDADQLAREVVEPGRPAHAAIAARWPQFIRSDGTLDRAGLGALVFADPGQRRELTAKVLPRIIEELDTRKRTLEASGHACCVFEAATLFEERLEHLVDGVLLVSLAPEEQVRRLVARSGLSEAEARARLAAQLPLEEKARRARWVLDNSGPEAGLAAKVRDLWSQILKEVC